MRLRRFNSLGMLAFRSYLDALIIDPSSEPPKFLLESDEYTILITPAIDVPEASLSSRMEAGRQLYSLLDNTSIANLERDAGLWTWLSLLFFDSVCPPDGNGRRKPGKYNRHIAEVDNWQKRHRHLLLSPYLVFRAHREQPERALAILCQPVHKPGDVVTQVTERQEYWSNKGVVEAASRLYYDAEARRDKVGAQNKNKGGARRFADLLNQLDLNWYLYGMTAQEILGLLPKEFDRFRSQKAS